MSNLSPSSSENLLLASPEDSIDLRPIFLAVLRGKKLILLLAFAFGITAFLYVMHQPITYQAQIELLPPQTPSTSGIAALSGGTGVAALGAAVQARNQVDSFSVMLQAWPLLDGLVKRLNLVKAYGVPDVATARAVLAARTSVAGTREGFIHLSVIDTDRQRSADIANAYVDQARDFLRGMALSEASQRRQFYEVQLAGAKEALIKAEDDFRRMRQTSGIVSIDAQATGLLTEATTLRSQITAKEVEIQRLRGYSTASNPQVQIAESELSALQGQLSQLESRGQGGYTGKSLSSVPGTELEFVRATRELKYQETLYDLMVKQYEGSKLDEARDAPSIQVVEPALVPTHKFGPHKAKAGLTGFGVGLIVGLLIVLYRYWHGRMSPEAAGKWMEIRRALRWSA